MAIENDSQCEDIFDHEYLTVNFADSPQLLRELLDLFADDAMIMYHDIREAYLKQDLPAMEMGSHKIKGASASVGAKRIKEVAEKIEVNTRNGDTTPLEYLLPLLDREIQSLLQERNRFA